ncbi:MAG: GNAT family N-acetyltransferase [Ruminococcus sp.]|nr:GNAT family N-acetyltransferase [Ruminococcus sp.]
MLTHKGTQTIKTERLVLRQFTPEDAQAMYNNWAKDERVTKFLTWAPHENLETTQYVLGLWCADYKRDDWYQWAIEYKGEVIGSISVVRCFEANDSAEIGYCMGYDYWGKGIMTEAAKAVIDFLFSQINVNKVVICHAVKNPASGKVAQKCGLTFEGTHREEFKALWGEFLDISCYGIVRKDWEKQKNSD